MSNNQQQSLAKTSKAEQQALPYSSDRRSSRSIQPAISNAGGGFAGRTATINDPAGLPASDQAVDPSFDLAKILLRLLRLPPLSD